MSKLKCSLYYDGTTGCSAALLYDCTTTRTTIIMA